MKTIFVMPLKNAYICIISVYRQSYLGIYLWFRSYLVHSDKGGERTLQLEEQEALLSGGSDGKESACNAGDQGLIPEPGGSPGEGNGNPLQYSCLENSMDRGAWRATVHGAAKSQTWSNSWHLHFSKDQTFAGRCGFGTVLVKHW